MPSPALPTLEEIAKQFEKPGKPSVNQTTEDVLQVQSTETKAAGQGKEPGDTPVTVVNTDPEVTPETEIKAAVPAAPEKPHAAAFAALARKEKENREARKAIEAQERQIREREARLQAHETKLATAKDPLSILREHGFTYDDATQHAIGAWKAPEKDPLDLKLEGAFKPLNERLDSVEALKAQIKELQQDRFERADREWTTTIQETVKAGQHIRTEAMGSEGVDLVKDVQRAFHEKNPGKYLPYSDACARVEQYYSELHEKLTAVTNRTVPTGTSAPNKSLPKTEAKPSAPTLTQSHSQGTRAKPDLDKLSKHDALAFLATTLRYKD